jgi:hypothetical protein
MAARAQLGSMFKPELFRTISLVIDVSFRGRTHSVRDILILIGLLPDALHFVDLSGRAGRTSPHSSADLSWRVVGIPEIDQIRTPNVHEDKLIGDVGTYRAMTTERCG